MAEPRWLSPEQRATWIAFNLVVRTLWSQLERDMQGEAGMPLTYYEILSVLSERPERAMRLAALGQLLELSPSRLSHAVSRLEASGWVRRELCHTDRRGWVAILTDAGMARVMEAAPGHVESVQARLFDQLSPAQVSRLKEISETLLSHLSPSVRQTLEALAMQSAADGRSDT